MGRAVRTFVTVVKPHENLLAAISVGLLALGLPQTGPLWQALTWPTAEAIVESSVSWNELFVRTVDKFETNDQEVRKIRASYTYEVEGRRFSGSYRGRYSRSRALQLSRGARVTVRYRSREPHRSVLWPRVPFTSFSAIGLGCLVGWHAVAMRLRRKRASLRPATPGP